MLVVMKFGGTSVRDETARSAAISQVQKAVAAGDRVAIVVSAMGRKGEPYATDSLIGLLRDAGEPVAPRELDLAMSVGETLSAAFFAHLLNLAGTPASAFTGQQAGFLTDATAGQAEILSIDPKAIATALGAGHVAVVAGFQGADGGGEIRTLGRGGSDTSAVALGAALGADRVDIFTDVDGIAAADPRRIPEAQFIGRIGAAQVLAMAEEGSKVLHPRAVRASLETKTFIRVCNTFTETEGTLVHHDEEAETSRPIALAHREGLILIGSESENTEALMAAVPELVPAGENRWLLPDDVYAQERLARLGKVDGDLQSDPDWATLSIVFSAPDPDAGIGGEIPPPLLQVPGPAGVVRFLAPASDLGASLKLLFDSFIAPR